MKDQTRWEYVRSVSHTTTASLALGLALQQGPHLLGHGVGRVGEREGASFVDDFFGGVVAFDAGETGVLRRLTHGRQGMGCSERRCERGGRWLV